MRVLDLFSGIGGFSLGLERAGMQTVAFCEINPFCQQILRKHWPNIPIYSDIKTIDYEGTVDLICGGYPCQPFSIAGKRAGQEDDRHLWPAMFACIKKYRPDWIIGENVAGHISMGLDDVLSDLESEDYETIPFVIPACAVGAPHRRDRIWILAHTKSIRYDWRGSNENSDNRKRQGHQNKCNNRTEIRCKTSTRFECDESHAPYSRSERIQRIIEETLQGESAFSWCQDIRRIEDYFNRPDIPQPLICRGDDGFSGRMDRLKSLGNAVVPQIPEIIGSAIMSVIHDQD